MSQAIPVRRSSGQVRRPKRPKRASAGLSSLRAGAALVMVVAALAIYGATASSAFAFRRLDVEGSGRQVVTDDMVRQQLGVAEGANLFLVGSDQLAATLRQLPAVIRADVAVRLPDTIRVDIAEREAILAWVVGERRLLVDRDGLVFADVPATADQPGARLPAIADSRSSSAALEVGAHIDPVDLDAATRLGSVKAAQVGSAAGTLQLVVDDADGYTMRPSSGAWSAVFGFYTPTLRTPDIIPGQVQALRSLLLAQGEANVKRVVLATDRGGTYLPRATANPGASAGASASP